MSINRKPTYFTDPDIWDKPIELIDDDFDYEMYPLEDEVPFDGNNPFQLHDGQGLTLDEVLKKIEETKL